MREEIIACALRGPGLPGGLLPKAELLPKEVSRKYSKQIPKPPQLAPLDAKEQWLYSSGVIQLLDLRSSREECARPLTLSLKLTLLLSLPLRVS